MSLLMLMVASKKKVVYVPTLHTQVFTANGSFPVPAGLSSIDKIIGYGAPGTPAGDSDYAYHTRVVARYFRRDNGATDTVIQNANDWTSLGSGNGTDYCEPLTQTPDNAIYYQQLICYYYTINLISGSPAKTGASATAFGKVFPGGAGGPASPVEFDNVPVTAGATYPVVVPSGGSITITYTA